MTVDITQIPYADFGPNSLVIVRLPSGTEHDIETVDQIARDLRGHIPSTVSFVIMKSDTEISHHTLEQLVARAGQCLCSPAERAILDALP